MNDKQRRAMFAKTSGIKLGQNPENESGVNKFVDVKKGEGLRGRMLAISKNKKKAIILSMNKSIYSDGVKWGKLYEVEEKKSGQYPILKKEVTKIPDTEDWTILK